MLGIKVRKENAESVKRYLTNQKLMVVNYRLISSDEFIYFPIAGRGGIGGEFLRKNGASFVGRRFPESGRKSEYRDMLKERLGKRYDEVSRGYDLLGDIAIVESDNAAAAKKMAQVIMQTNKNVKTVLSKGGPVSGAYRTRKYRYIAGKRNYEALYRENGAVFKFDVRETFFSPRLGFERNRVATGSKDGENVLVMFAGVGPYAIEIAKSHKKSKIIAMELNRKAYSAMLENIKLNNVPNVTAECGDVRKLSLKHRNFADRIVMPHPTDSYSFLDSVLKTAGKRCIVHYYAFGNREDAFESNKSRLREYFDRHGIKFRLLSQRLVRNYSPSEIEIVLDFVISRT